MKPCLALLPFLVALAILGSGRADPSAREQPVPDAKRVQELIRQLGSDEFATREKAASELERIGVPALEQLQKAAKSEDLEIRRTAEELVAKIQARNLAVTMLAPRKVSLDLKDISVTEAVVRLARQSGYAIQLAPGPVDQKITLQVRDVPFWEALSQLCQKAGLTENRAGAETNKGAYIQLRWGKGSELAAGSFGSVRLCLLPRNQAQVSVPAGKDGEAVLILDAIAEPRLRGFGMVGIVRVARALDDQGQTLQVTAATETAPAEAGGNQGVINFIGGPRLMPEAETPQGQRQVALRVARGDKPARLLRELSGVVTAQCYRDLEGDLLVIDNILKAAGTTTKGKNGEVIEIQSITQQDSGEVRVQALLRNLSGQGPQGAPGIRGNVINIQGNANVMVGGVRIGGEIDPVRLPRLLDSQGQPYQLAENSAQGVQIGPAGVARQVTLVYRPGAGQKEPARMVLRGQQRVLFEVPFTLKNVPLP